jgi:hypothetical protein
MGDAGEALIDAEDRMQERLAEREHLRSRSRMQAGKDPVQERQRQSLELAKRDMERQAAAVSNPQRQQQIRETLVDLDRRLAAF